MAKAVAIVVLAMALGTSQSSKVDPIQQVVTMISDLESKIIAEGEDAQKVYKEFAEFCEDRSRNVGFEIKTGKGEVKSLNAAIDKETATAASLTAKIEELSAAIANDEADLKAATTIRDKEKAVFVKEQAELEEILNTLERAIRILETEMAKAGGVAMVQLQSARSVAQALSVMVEATSISSADASKLTAFMQNMQDAEDAGVDAPAAAVFKSQSGGIVEALQNMHEKANEQLEEARSTETKNERAYQMLQQSLNDSIKYATEDLNKTKKGLAASGEAKSTAEGDLSVTSSDLSEDVETLSTLRQDCMTGAENFEGETKSRGEELKALAQAKKVIKSTTSGASDQSYGFLQLKMSTGADLANFEAVRFVRDLAHKQNSPVLAQLAQKMAQVMRSGTKDPFGKVTELIRNLIERLEAEGEADATEKSYCDKEMAYTEDKIAFREEIIAKLSTSIDSMSAKSAQLKEHVAVLQKQLADLARAQAEMDKLRAEENAAYKTNSAEMEQGIAGVRQALKILRDYYAQDGKAHGAAEGAGNSIIGLLEVCESDFTQGLAEMTAAEDTAAKDYDMQTKENEITKTKKDQDVQYKTKEAKSLDKQTAEATNDKATTQTELDSVNEYYKSLQARCVAKAETYEERTSRRAAEIAGLKQALEILNGEAVLLQRSSKHATLRGVRRHA
jgi:hypothetical protein